ncbi:MAG TPA: c-type cytochrome [Casimicrobiaceae bacterium]|nr:c-type cytochrome [Casimicrobiaceae bacterium]
MKTLLLAAAAGISALTAHAQDDAAVRQKAAVCVACHGPNGNSANPDYPILAGQTWRYLYIELRDFKAGRRSDPQMSPMTANLSDEDMVALANFFAAQKQAPIPFKADPAKVEAGRKTSDTVLCPMCHLGGFVGQNEIPRVAGQWPQYIKKQLEDFKAKRRTNDAGNMTSVAYGLSEQDIDNLAQYIANLY